MSRLNISDDVPLSKRMPSSSFPALRLSETRDHMTVVALVPGFEQDNLDITIVKDLLSISGRSSAGVPGGFNAVRQGRRSADFKSEIKLMADVAWSDSEAWLERGVLTIRMRKDAVSSRATIPIRVT